MINQVRLAGTLGGDAVTREFQNGDRVVNLRVACTERLPDGQGGTRDLTFWATVVVRGARRVERLKDLRKGAAVEIDGRLATRKYQKDGRDIYVTEVIVEAPQHRCWALDFGRRAGGDQPDPDAPSAPVDDEVPY